MTRGIGSSRLTSFAVWAVVSVLTSCGPRHEDGDGEGEGGTAGEAGAAAAGGSSGSGGGGIGAAGGGPSGGSSAGAGASGAGGTHAGGSSGRLGYDSVIGCAPRRYADQATLTFLPDEPEIYAQKLSGDGRVVAGQVANFGPTFRWRPETGVEVVDGLRYRVSNVNCDGSVLVTADTSGGSWRHRVGEEAEQVIPGGDYFQPDPVSLTPDGAVVVGHLIGGVDLGPHPVRWTAATGLKRVEPLENTLLQGVTPDGNTVLGVDVLRIFRFTLGGTKEFVQGWVPSNGYGITGLTVSANGQTYVFSATPTSSALLIDSIRGTVDCPSVSCSPVAISGTGKVVIAVGPTGPEVGAPWATFVWTARHGFRTLSALLSAFGAPPSNRLLANDVSDDGQVFTGYTDDSNDNPHRQFYATLPPAAYD